MPTTSLRIVTSYGAGNGVDRGDASGIRILPAAAAMGRRPLETQVPEVGRDLRSIGAPLTAAHELEAARARYALESMRLEGIHHITAITADAPANVDFYARVLGLRLVKKSVNQDDPTVYHLFYADEHGSAGSDLTFFEYPGSAPGRAGAGMVHRVVWRVGSDQALDFWSSRLDAEGVEVERAERSLRFADPEGLAHELTLDGTDDEPLIAEHPEVPAELALRGFDAVRAYSADPDASRDLLERALGFAREDAGWEVRGERRGSRYRYDSPPAEPGVQGAGTVHHVAWASSMEEHEAWRERVIGAGGRPTPVIDRFYFRSIYFREPSGVLFEIATLGPGFSIDEDPERLGERISLPPSFEPQRERIERTLRPLENPRTTRVR
jgi:glyoxalase family protein